MGIATWFSARSTIKILKLAAVKDRIPLSDENALLFTRESLMNKLEFSRPTCVGKYLLEKGAAGDALLATVLRQLS